MKILRGRQIFLLAVFLTTVIFALTACVSGAGKGSRATEAPEKDAAKVGTAAEEENTTGSAAETAAKSGVESASETAAKSGAESAAETAAEGETEDVSESAAKGEKESVTESAEESITESAGEEKEMTDTTDDELINALAEDFFAPRESMGELWSVSAMRLSDNALFEYNAHRSQRSASVIKVFIMGTVYERICYPAKGAKPIAYKESYEGELRSLIESMITVSSNDAANALISILGEGDYEAGFKAVNDFCAEHGFNETHLGRIFLAENPDDDNYTSAGDCCSILSQIYKGTLVNEEASAKMYDILKGQTVRHKIPAGLPEGYSCANKTGEMPMGYDLGCIENDIAIISGPDGDYVLAVLSEELGGRNSEADAVIASVSSAVAGKIEKADAMVYNEE